MSRYLAALHDLLELEREISESTKSPSVESVETPQAPPRAGSEISKTAKSPSVESVETTQRRGLDTLDTSLNRGFSDSRTAPRRGLDTLDTSLNRGFSDSQNVPAEGLDTLDTCSTGASRDFQAANEPSIDADDEATIRAWLAYIGEADEQIIGEVLTMCATDPAALDYYLGRADEMDDADEQEAA